MKRIYLDYNATALIRPDVIDLVAEVMDTVGNASSVHSFGREARKYVEEARRHIAALIQTKPEQIIFGSGATEANNTVLAGLRDKRVLVSAIEHPAVLDAAPHAEKIPVTKDGIVDLEALTPC